MSLSEMTQNHFDSFTDADIANQEMITLLLSGISSDVDALHFCDIVENLVDNNPSRRVVDLLRKGMYVLHTYF